MGADHHTFERADGRVDDGVDVLLHDVVVVDRFRHRDSVRGQDEHVGDQAPGRRLRQQPVELVLQAHQARVIGHRHLGAIGCPAGEREPVGDDDGEEPVVVAHHQLGVVDVDLAGVREQRHVLAGRHDPVDHRLADLQGRALLDLRRAGELAIGRDALRRRQTGEEVRLALGEDDEREPGCPLVRGVGLALPRQGAPLDDDLRQAGAVGPASAGRRIGREHLVGREHVARRGDVHVQPEVLDRQRSGGERAVGAVGGEVLVGGEAVEPGLERRRHAGVEPEVALGDAHRGLLVRGRRGAGGSVQARAVP